MVNFHQIFILDTCVFFGSRMTFGEIGTGLTCDSQYYEIYKSHYTEILCIYKQYLNILFFALPVNVTRPKGNLTEPLQDSRYFKTMYHYQEIIQWLIRKRILWSIVSNVLFVLLSCCYI